MEIRMWWNVELVDDFHSQIGSSHENQVLEHSELALILTALDASVRQHQYAVYVTNHLALNVTFFMSQIKSDLQRDGIVLGHQNQTLVVRGYLVDSEAFQLQVVQPLNCLRGHHCPTPGLISVDETNLIAAAEAVDKYIQKIDQISLSQSFCSIKLRDDIMYGDAISNFPTESSTDNNIIRIGLGVPTTSNRQMTDKDSSILTTFLPAFLDSISDQEKLKFHFTVYIGYDFGDKFWDLQNSSSWQAVDSLSAPHSKYVTVKYVRLPFTFGWVTFIWNRLFALSIQDNNDYFYQVNDDLSLVSAGWATKFTQALQKSDDVGVVGPFDPRWNCTILTQAMVSRKHWSIFGTFYPPEIKDWYSDFWISKLYGASNTFCTRDIVAVNQRDKGTRYTLCNRIKWYEIVLRDRQVLSKWKNPKLIQSN